MSEALQQLLDILQLEKIDTNIYRGITPETSNRRVFGGQVFAQAMRAAQDTVDAERSVIHSMPIFCARATQVYLFFMRLITFVMAGRLLRAVWWGLSEAKRYSIPKYPFKC